MRLYIGIILLLSVLLLTSGCRVNLPAGALQYSRSQDTGTISRSFEQSHSYDTKILRVKRDARYTWDIDVALQSGTVAIELQRDEATYFSLAGDRIKEEISLQLAEGEYLIVIHTENAVAGRIAIDYRSDR